MKNLIYDWLKVILYLDNFNLYKVIIVIYLEMKCKIGGKIFILKGVYIFFFILI